MSGEVHTPVKVDIQQPTPAIANPWANMAYKTAYSISGRVRRVHWKTWVVTGSFSAAMILYAGQWQKPAPPKELDNDYDVRNIPAFDESGLIKDAKAAIDQNERNLSAFLNEERQRKTIAIAQAYRGLAVMFIQSPNHVCNGKTELACLATFDANRVAALQELSDRKPQVKEVSPNSVISPLLEQSAEVDRVEGLRLAKILAKPVNSREDWEQWDIDMRYPLLNSGLPAEELRPRPAMLAKLLRQNDEQRQQLLNSSQESTARLENCLSLSPEQQQARGGCN